MKLTERIECIHPRLKIDHIEKDDSITYKVGKCYDCKKETVITIAYREVVAGIYELKEEFLKND